MASTAIAPLLRGGQRNLRVLAVFPQAAYLAVGDDVVTLATSDGIRHPNGMTLNLSSTSRPLARIAVGQVGRIGNGGIRLGDLEIRVSRWWEPTPRLRATTPAGLIAASGITRKHMGARAGGMQPRHDPSSHVDLDVSLSASLTGSMAGTLAALAVGDDIAALAAARGGIGLGPGLTPSGDDRLAGLVAGTLVLAPSLGAGGWATGGVGGRARGGVGTPACGPSRGVPADLARVVAAAQRLGRAIAQTAVGRTTSVSAALLAHAALGQLADPAAGLVRAWTVSAGPRVASLPAQVQDATRNTRHARTSPTDAPNGNAPNAHADIVRATDRLLAVGSSSGLDLTLGLLAAADLLTGAHTDARTRTPT